MNYNVPNGTSNITTPIPIAVPQYTIFHSFALTLLSALMLPLPNINYHRICRYKSAQHI